MTNILKQFVSITLAAAVMFSASSVSMAESGERNPAKIVTAALPGSHQTTPDENVFKIAGSSKEFIVLDRDDAGVYVLAKQCYGNTRAYDPDGTQKFDVSDENNIAYWLNNTLIDPKGDTGFPTEFINFLAEYDYPIEAGNKSGNCPYDYTVRAKVALLSQTEYIKYADKFGFKDAIPYWGWWLRTGYADSPDLVIWASTYEKNYGRTYGQSGKTTSTGYVRPAFHLSDDFFRNVRLDIASMGENAKKTIFEEIEYTTIHCYNAQEIRYLGAKDAPVKVKLPENDAEVSQYTKKLTVYQNGMSILPPEVIKNPDFSQGLWEISENCSLENNQVIMHDGAYMVSGAYLNPSKTYEISLDMSLEKNSDEKAVKLQTLSFDAEGKCMGSMQDVIVLGGERKRQNYRIPVTMRDENTEMIMLVLSSHTSSNAVINSFGIRAIEEDIHMESDWAPYYLLNDTGESFDIKINIDSAYSRYYKVAYSMDYYHDGFNISGESKRQEIYPNKTNTIKIDLPQMHYGSGMLKIRVMDGNRCAKEIMREICVYKPYTKHYFDKYSLGAINASVDDALENGESVMETITSLGFNKRRWDPHWNFIEKAKGMYDWRGRDANMNMSRKWEMDTYIIGAYNNPLYSTDAGTDNKKAMNTPEELKGYCEFVTSLAARYPEIGEVEVWNEPNGNGYWHGANPYEYTNAAKTFAAAMRLENPDVKVMAGSIDVSKDGMGYSKKMFDYGIWPYIGSFSVHPYYHPQTNDKEFPGKTRGYIQILEDHGAWKDVDLTEIGWRTTADDALISQQAEELVKILAQSNKLNVIPTIYNFHERNTASDAVFGIARNDFSIRPSGASVSNYFNFTAGGEYITYVTAEGNSNSFIYYRDGEPIIMAWDPEGDEKLTFGYNVQVFDLFGNSKGYMNEVPLTASPVYIKGAKMEWLMENTEKTIKKKYADFLEEHSEILSDSEKALIMSLSEELDVDKHYAAGRQILENHADYRAEFTDMMYDLHLIGEILSKYCTINDTKIEDKNTDFDELSKKYNQKTNNSINSLPFTSEILRNAKTFNTEYNDLMKERGTCADKAFFANYRTKIISGLCSWAQETIDKEEIMHLGVTVCIEPAEVEAYDRQKTKVDISLLNYTGKDREGKLEIYNTEGTLVAEKDNVKIKNKDFTRVSVEFEAYEKEINTQMMYGIKFISEGEDYNHLMPVTKRPIVEVTQKDAVNSVDKLTSVEYTVKNIANISQDVNMSLTLPEGWESAGDVNITLGPGESKDVSMRLSKVVPTAYNYYPIGLTIKSNENVLYSETKLLNFAVISKASSPIDVPAFEGDISQWRNAYPYYISPPSDVISKDGWHNKDVAARMFSKYDNEYLYFMIDVYDETHMNAMTGESIWNGDCVQIAIDAGNNRSTSGYDGDDYEFASALTDFGQEIWCHADGSRKETGARDASWSKVVRDDNSRNTRYMIKIPISELPPLNASEGKFVNMDIAVADSDLLAIREDAISICGTITTGKRPDLFKSWYFIDSGNIDFTDDAVTSSIFSETMEE